MPIAKRQIEAAVSRARPLSLRAPVAPAVTEPRADPAMTEEVARYIGLMTTEMVGMARSARLELLAYFLDMARIEANVALNRRTTGDREPA
jgi:hypothetical protein